MHRAGAVPAALGTRHGHAMAVSMAMAAPAAPAPPLRCVSALASRADRELPETSVGAHGRGFSCRAASARATLLPAAAALAAGMRVPFVSSSEKFIRRRRRQRRGNRDTVPTLAARK